MTPSTEIFRVSYNGDGSQKVFDITFPFFQNAHIEALLRDAAGKETVLVEGIGYTLTGGAGASGKLIATTAPAAGATIVIRRNVPLTQETDYPEGGPFPSASHEDALDFARMVDQQQQEQLDRALKLPGTDPDTSIGEFRKSTARMNSSAGFDDEGRPRVGIATLHDIDALVSAGLGTGILPSEFPFTGDGAATTFVLGGIQMSSAQAILFVIDGIVQASTTYAVDVVNGNTEIEVTTALPIGAAVAVRVIGRAQPFGTGDATGVSFQNTGTGAFEP